MSVLDTLVRIIVFHDIITHCICFFLLGSLYGDVTSHLLQSQMDGWMAGWLSGCQGSCGETLHCKFRQLESALGTAVGRRVVLLRAAGALCFIWTSRRHSDTCVLLFNTHTARPLCQQHRGLCCFQPLEA